MGFCLKHGFAFCWIAAFCVSYGAELIGVVTKVSDGDTVWVTVNGCRREKVRLNRIDAPESDQPYGKAAAKRLKELVDGKSVRVVYEDADRYGRILGIVYVSDSDINLQMLREGCAWHYKYYDKTKSYSDAENEARAAKRGLWEAHNPINPYEWRKSKRSNRRRR
jgi:endonuclease YncB( thermonuclease family)